MKKSLLALSLSATLILFILFEAVVYQITLFNERESFVATVGNQVSHEALAVMFSESNSAEELLKSILDYSKVVPYSCLSVVVDSNERVYSSSKPMTYNDDPFSDEDLSKLEKAGKASLAGKGSSLKTKSMESGEVVEYTYIGTVNKEKMIALVVFKIDSSGTVLKSDDFIFYTVENALLLLITETIVFVLLVLYFRNKRKTEMAKSYFTVALAHEIKTPVTEIVNLCDCITENVSPKDNERYFASILDCTERITRLTDSFSKNTYLGYTKKLNREQILLPESVKSELGKYTELFSKKNIRVEQAYDNICISADRALIAAVINNFISNAAKYTEENGRVKISVSKIGNRCVFKIYNDTSAALNCKTVWDSAYRYDKVTNHTYGIGLSVCKRILTLHRFKYSCQKKEGGVEFSFSCTHRNKS